MTDLLAHAALEIAAALVQPMHPRQAQAVLLSHLEEAGFGAAYLRLEGNALHWEYNPAHLTPTVLEMLKQHLHVMPVSLMPLPLDKTPILRETIDSLSVRFFDLEQNLDAGEGSSDIWKASAGIMRAMGARRDIHIPVAYDNRALGVIVVWGDMLTPEDCESAGYIGRILGSALHRTDPVAERQVSLPSQDALQTLQAILATLAVDQPIEESLATIRDAMPRAIPNLLPPIFGLRDFEKGEWNFKSLLPGWAGTVVEKRLGKVLDGLHAPVGASEAWRTLSAGNPVYASDAAQLVGHILTPQIARAIQKALRIGTIAVFAIGSGGHVLGLMFACSRKDAWDDDEKELLRACADSIGLALHNAHLYLRQRRSVRRMAEALNRAENILLPQSPQQRLQNIVDEAISLLNADAGALYVIHDRTDEVETLARRGLSERYADFVCANFANLKVSRVASLRVPTRVDDMTSDDIAPRLREAVLEEGLRCFMALPLVARGHFHGTLVLYRKRPIPFSDEAVLEGHGYAIICALSCETMRLMENEERKLTQLETMRQVLHELTGERDLKAVGLTILTHACRLTDSDSSALHLWDPATQRLVDQAGTYHGQPLDRAQILKSGEGLAGTVFETGTTVVLDDYYTWPRTLPFARQKSVGPALGVPIRLGGEIIGAIGLLRDIPKPLYDDEDVALAEALADEVAVYVAQARLKEQRDRHRMFSQRILDSIPSIVLVLDAHTFATLVVGQHFLDRSGWAREDVVGRSWLEQCVPTAWRDKVAAVFGSLREQQGGYRNANPILAKDGHEIPVQWYNTIVRDDDGPPLYIVSNGIIAEEQTQNPA